MHIMGMMNNQKCIYINRCAFCTRCCISNKLNCTEFKIPRDECRKFDEVEDVSTRVNELFDKLPAEYGRVIFLSERDADESDKTKEDTV